MTAAPLIRSRPQHLKAVLYPGVRAPFYVEQMASDQAQSEISGGENPSILNGTFNADSEEMTRQSEEKTRQQTGKNSTSTTCSVETRQSVKGKAAKNSKSSVCTSKHDSTMPSPDVNDESWTCERCSAKITDKNPMLLECDSCKTRVCGKCLKLNQTKFDILARKDVFWTCCSQCEQYVTQAISNKHQTEQLLKAISQLDAILPLLDRMHKIEGVLDGLSDVPSRMEMLERSVYEMDAKLNKTTGMVSSEDAPKEDKVDDQETEEDDVTLSKRPLENVPHQRVDLRDIIENEKVENKQVEGISEEAVAETEKEARDRNDRVNNIILFHAEESKEKERDKRRVEDVKLVEGFMEEILGNNIPSIEKISRLGPREDNKKRPIKVRLTHLEDKERLFSNLGNLRNAPDPFHSIIVRHDLTPQQHKKLKELQRDAEEENKTLEDNKYKHVVRSTSVPLWDPKIVKIKLKQKPQ